ncbi:hypothetical protein ACJX0J_039434, partial [Zea mays]
AIDVCCHGSIKAYWCCFSRPIGKRALIPSQLSPSQRKDVKPHYYQAESSPISTLKLVHTENTPAEWDHLNI